jgi:hypothetical protein
LPDDTTHDLSAPGGQQAVITPSGAAIKTRQSVTSTFPNRRILATL